MALDFLRPGAPHDQPLVDLPTAMSAIFVAVLNAGITTMYYLLPCHGASAAACAGAGDLELMHYDLYWRANFATAVLGVALLVVGMAFPATVLRSPAWPPVLKWMVWTAKVLTGVTLTYSLSVLHYCLRMHARPLFDWLSQWLYHHLFLTATIVVLCNLMYFYSVYCSELRRVA
ncbi:hypothetical protein GQ55_6G216400 [Panicum hallii var. hallii]|uniref:Uncharacterized protein n=1 Tax=Panicum hallii var. hallii TaxID=1504633 RepID=A0A2T7D852_9POAL|nr:hypothetical protein GQ55_6G216400 [Panicum hallii var. hallii]